MLGVLPESLQVDWFLAVLIEVWPQNAALNQFNKQSLIKFCDIQIFSEDDR